HAIAQVEDYLRANGIESQVAYDTAGAASEVALAGDRSVAAVAARRAATTYGLEVAAEIPSATENYTRFFAIARRGDHDVADALAREAARRAASGGRATNAAGRAPNDLHGSFIDETIGIVARQTRDTVSFAVGSPAPEALEMVGADVLARAVIARDGAKALGYTMTEGEPELREFVASAARGRGIPAAAAETLISAGASQAIDLVC